MKQFKAEERLKKSVHLDRETTAVHSARGTDDGVGGRAEGASTQTAMLLGLERCIFLLILINCFIIYESAWAREPEIDIAEAPEGWRMVDRFHGFRYELTGVFNDPLLSMKVIRDEADKYFCFGWVQNPLTTKIVGEARCNKKFGPELESFILSAGRLALLEESGIRTVEGVASHVYADTKIRFHFTNFRILDKDYDTCFDENPHACSEMRNRSDKEGL